MIRRIIPLFIILCLGLLLANCNSQEDVAPVPGDDTVNVPINQADPSLNELLVVAVDEELHIADPNTGANELVFAFEEYNDIDNLPEYHEGVAYCVNDDNGLTAIDLESKKILWETGIPDYHSSSIAKMSPVYYNNIIFVAGLYGIMVAADAATGDIQWQYDFKLDPDDYYENMYGRAVISGNSLVHGTGNSFEENYLHCIDITTGKRIWRVPLSEQGLTSSTVIADDVVYVPSNTFEARDLKTGAVIWQFSVDEDDGASTPTVVGDKVLFQGSKGRIEARLYCLDRHTGQLLWEADAGGDDAAAISPAVAGSVVFGVYERGSAAPFSINGRPFAVSLETGERLWENDRVSVDTSPVYANGRLYFQGQSFDIDDIDEAVGLMCLDAATGEFLWVNKAFRYGDYPPVVVAQNGVFKPGGW